MDVDSISAVTLAVSEMAQSVAFYRRLGLPFLYGGERASFASFRLGSGHLNLIAHRAMQTSGGGASSCA